MKKILSLMVLVAAAISAAAGTFSISVNNYRVIAENGQTVEAAEYGLSTNFSVVADPALTKGEGVPTLTFNGEDQGEATIFAYGYEGAGAGIQFNAAPASVEGAFKAAGNYTLTIPAGTFVDAEGNTNEAFEATWSISGSSITINDGFDVKVSTSTNNWGDSYYVVTMSVAVPENVKSAYCEGLLLDVETGVNALQAGEPTIENGVLTVVFKDMMPFAQTDPDDTELRANGTYTAHATIVLGDEEWNELGAANYTGSIVFDKGGETSSVIAGAEWGNLMHGVMEQDMLPFGVKLTLPNLKAEDTDNVIVAAFLNEVDAIDPEFGVDDEDDIDPGFGVKTPDVFMGMVNVETGLVEVALYPEDPRLVAGGKYNINVVAIYAGPADEEDLVWDAESTGEVLSVDFEVSNGIVEPEAVINMGPAMMSINEGDVINAADWNGFELFFPSNNLEEILGETDGWQWGAVALIGTEAYLYKEREEIASEHFASEFEADYIKLFSNASLEAGKDYRIVIPAGGLTVQDQSNYDDPILWSNAEDIVVNFSTKSNESNINIGTAVPSVENGRIFVTFEGNNFEQECPYTDWDNYYDMVIATTAVIEKDGEELENWYQADAWYIGDPDYTKAIQLTAGDKTYEYGKYVVTLPKKSVVITQYATGNWFGDTVWTNEEPIVMEFEYNENGVVTGINNINGGKSGIKFTLAGARANESAKGIVIMNGKKAIQK